MEQIRFDKKFRLLVPLEAQSPMIHFQARESGATIRATEVKPKFDRFLWERIRQRKLNSAGMIQKQPENDKRDASPALQYRMRIYCPDPPQVVSVNNGSVRGPDGRPVKLQDYSYSLFYGNSGKPTLDEQTMGVLSNPVLEIQCLHAELRKLIEESVTEFFLTTNFGTMQSKGFGSFAPTEYCRDYWLNDAQRTEIAGYLKEKTRTEIRPGETRPGICYCMLFDPPYFDEQGFKDFTDTFEAIRCFYQLMKSGYNGVRTGEYERSFLFRYMRGLGIGNEKAWMKQRGISPAIGRKPDAPSENETFRYVRAFLGAAGNMSYQTEDGRRVNVAISSDELPRVPSPIFFKVVKDTVFITAFPVPEEVYGKRYTFAGDRRRGYESGELKTPEAELFASKAFDMRDFMERYVDHYNRLIWENRLPKFLRGAKEATPI